MVFKKNNFEIIFKPLNYRPACVVNLDANQNT